MKILGSDGSSLSLAILGYQFPELIDAPYDSNFLIIQVDVVSPMGSWTATDHCLLTYEVSRIADWLDKINAGDKTIPPLGFIEPMMEFHVIESHGKEWLRVYFEGFLRPSWAGSRSIGKMDLWVEFNLREMELGALAKDLRSELQYYPQRAAK